jgi:hypothetical protein
MLALPSARYLPLAAACLVTLAAPGLRAQAPATASGPVVSLPPFVVQSAGGPPWRYTHPPGFEVLSRWSDSNTKEFADELLGARKLFDAVLPPEFQAQFSVPTTYVLVPDVQTDALPAPLMAQVLAHAQPAGSDSRRPTEVRFTPNLMLWDRDALVVFGLKPSEAIEDGGVAFFSDLRTRLMLERRTPTLPGWFVSGFYDLYAGMDFTQRAADTGAAGWISKEAVAALAADPDAPRRLLPLAELFAEPPAAGAPAAPDALARARLRQAEAALFIRWGLDGVGAPRRAALWKFVNAAAAGPVTEAQFEALFGEDYVSALNDLSDFLPWAATHSLRLVPIQDPVDEEIRMRDATPAEVGRIKGDWERLEMDQVALQYPELVPKYRDRAQETFNLAYQDDKSDPGLLAVMGLFAVDCGQPTVAEPLLRAAAAGHVVRPRVYYELARRLLTELTTPAPGKAPPALTPIQAGTLLELLDQARAQAPALPEVFGLYYEVTQAAEARPSPALLNVFREGVRLFPENPALSYEAAIMLARGGDLAGAGAVLQRGLALATEPTLRSHMATLQSELVSIQRGRGAAATTP